MQLVELQRRRVLSAMASVTCQQGLHAVTVSQLLHYAKVGRRGFYDLFASREDCLLALFDETVAAAEQQVRAGIDQSAPWAARVRGGLGALLEFFDDEPELARVCVVHAMAGARPVLNRRRAVLFDLAHLIDSGRVVRRSTTELPPFTAEGIIGAVFSLVYDRLLAPEQARLITLLNPLMAIVVLPYMGAAAAQRELARAPGLAPATPKRPRRPSDPLQGLQMRLTHRTMSVLNAILRSPAASNREIAKAAGIKDPGQMSKLLSRLEQLGLLCNTGPGQVEGGSNAWTLTARGTALARSLGIADVALQAPRR